MAEIKAIETIFNGDRYRSRLEARYAVFFSKANIKYEYEPEGFMFGEYRYLPDFFLPELGCYIEIKPESENLEYATELFQKLIAFGSMVAPIICFKGVPTLSWNGMAYCLDLTNGSGGEFYSAAGFAFCHVCNKVVVSFSDEEDGILRSDRILCNPDLTTWKNICDPKHRHAHSIGELEPYTLAARQAQFEHGKHGQ